MSEVNSVGGGGGLHLYNSDTGAGADPGEQPLTAPTAAKEDFITAPRTRPAEGFITDAPKLAKDEFITAPRARPPEGFITDGPTAPKDEFITAPKVSTEADPFISDLAGGPSAARPAAERRALTAGDHALHSVNHFGNFVGDLWEARYSEAVTNAGQSLLDAGAAFGALLFGDDTQKVKGTE
jgi:hypothetical protein